MAQESPHPDALGNFEKAYIPEGKMHYALEHVSKGRVFKALGYSKEAGNWKALRDAILKGLPTTRPSSINKTSLGSPTK
jgi:hypothetical protein